MPQDSKDSVFIVHGRDEKARSDLAAVLERMGLQVVIFVDPIHWPKKGSPHAREVLESKMHSVTAVVVLMSGDDEGRLRSGLCADDESNKDGALERQARQNVIFEAGMALGLFPNRTVLVQTQRLRVPSDIDGVQYVRFDGSRGSHLELAHRLRAAGCRVSLDVDKDPPDAMPGSDLPPIDQGAKTGKLAMFRRLWNLLPFPGMGGSLEIVKKAKIGQKVILSINSILDGPPLGLQCWLPGSVSPIHLTLDGAIRNGEDIEIPYVIAGPPGFQVFDLVTQPERGGHPKIASRVVCDVSRE